MTKIATGEGGAHVILITYIFKWFLNGVGERTLKDCSKYMVDNMVQTCEWICRL